MYRVLHTIAIFAAASCVHSKLLRGLPQELALHVPCALQLCREGKPWYLPLLQLLQISGLRREVRHYKWH